MPDALGSMSELAQVPFAEPSLDAPGRTTLRGLPRKPKGKRRVLGPDEYVCYVPTHPTPYDFTPVVRLAGETFCKRLVAIWPQAFTGEVWAYTQRRRAFLIQFFEWAVAAANVRADGPEATLLAGLPDCEIDHEAYSDATAAFCARLHDLGDSSVSGSESKRTRNNIINGLGSTLSALAKHGLLPIDHGMTAIRTGPFEPRVLTVAEVAADCDLDSSDPCAAFAVLLRNPALAKRLGIQPESLPALGAQELAEAMVKIIELRLDALRSCAVADLEAEVAAFEVGEALVSRADLPGPAQIEKAILERRNAGGIKTVLERLETSPWAVLPGRPEQRLLAYMVRYLAPRYSSVFNVNLLPVKIGDALRACGGVSLVTRHLEATMPAKTAAHLIVLIDTMFNVSVCDRLAGKPFTGRVSRGRAEIATVEAIKARAGGKVVHGKILVSDVSESSPKFRSKDEDQVDESESRFLEAKRVDARRSGVWAINAWLKMSKPLRERSEREGSDAHLYLWLLPEGGERHRGTVRRPHFTSDHAAWGKFLKRHADDPIIGRLPITREMIRVSGLQARSGPHADSGLVMPSLAQHASPRTTHSYGSTGWMEGVLAEQIRGFQNLLEAAAGAEIADIARILGIDPKVALARRELALQTGLGFFCADPLAGERPGTVKGEACDKLEDCPRCRLRRFVPNPEALDALWLFGEALRGSRAEWEATKPDRWRAIWLPWLAIVTATENMLLLGRFKLRWERAAAAAAARVASEAAILPVLW